MRFGGYPWLSIRSSCSANKIRKLREFRNFTQEYMADRLQVEQNTYSRYETGQTKLTTERIQQIADALEVPVRDLLNNSPIVVSMNDLAREDAGSGHVTPNALFNKMWSHMEERSQRLEELYTKTLEVFSELAKRKK